jgi:hypothetical protein
VEEIISRKKRVEDAGNRSIAYLKGPLDLNRINRMFSVTSTPYFREWALEKAGGSGAM